MQILATDADLVALLTPAEKDAYIGPQSTMFDQVDIVSETISMDFDSPSSGHLTITATYKSGADHFIIKFFSQLQSPVNSDQRQCRHLTLVGDAHTGIIIALLPQSENIHPSDTHNPITTTTNIPELSWADIQQRLETTGNEAVWQLQNQGFKAFSRLDVVIPEVIYLPFKGRGDLHLKGAHKSGGDIYVFKIATAFYNNSACGLTPSQGLMMAFDAKTGDPIVVLKDEGNLTDLRTAIAGRNAAQQLMPEVEVTGIGVLGTGVQARLQVSLLKDLYPQCRQLTVWGHTPTNTVAYAREMTQNGWQVTVVDSPKQVAKTANLIVTTTASEVALLEADDITKENTLVIAIGADMPGKLELAPSLLKKADCVLIDSIKQGKDHGNAADALHNGVIVESDLQEFGDFLNNGLKNPQAAKKLKLFLSSGIGVQDLQIVQAVLAGS